MHNLLLIVESLRKYVDCLEELLKITEVVRSEQFMSTIVIIALLDLNSKVHNVYPKWIISLPGIKSIVASSLTRPNAKIRLISG